MTEAALSDVWRPAVSTAVATLGLGVLLSAVGVWAIAGVSAPLDLLRYAVLVWLVGAGSSVRLDGDLISIVPVGMTVIFGVITFLVARWQYRRSSAPASTFTAVTACVAGLASAIIAVVVSRAGVEVSMIRAAFGTFVLVAVASGIAAYRRTDQPWFGLPARWRVVAEGAVTGVFLLAGAATLLTLIALMTSVEQAATMWASLNPGGEAPLLGLLLVVAFPTLVSWTIAGLLGPGFALGEGTRVDLAGSSVEHLPAVPLLAAIPEPGPHPVWMFALAAVPVVCGVVVGWWTHRQSAVDADWRQRVGDGALAGALAGLAIGVLVALSAGGVGPGTLQVAGPVWWLPGLIAVGVLALGAALGAGVSHYRGVRGRS